jgi:ComF family protein
VEEHTNFINSIKWHILDLLFPEKCLGCHKRGDSLCDNCISNIRQDEREMENNIYAIYDYREPLIKKAIWNLKYYHRLNLGNKLGKLLYENLLEEISDIKILASGCPIYVIPVPISKNRMKNRGYNQAEIIARSFSTSGNTNTLELRKDIICKILDTKPQARITNRKDRLNNVKGVFGISNKSIISGKTFIIIDDVTTTGGTINEIIKILKKNGAKKVVGFAVAH